MSGDRRVNLQHPVQELDACPGGRHRAHLPLEACVLGWQESLRHLARLVEPVIPG